MALDSGKGKKQRNAIPKVKYQRNQKYNIAFSLAACQLTRSRCESESQVCAAALPFPFATRKTGFWRNLLPPAHRKTGRRASDTVDGGRGSLWSVGRVSTRPAYKERPIAGDESQAASVHKLRRKAEPHPQSPHELHHVQDPAVAPPPVCLLGPGGLLLLLVVEPGSRARLQGQDCPPPAAGGGH